VNLLRVKESDPLKKQMFNGFVSFEDAKSQIFQSIGIEQFSNENGKMKRMVKSTVGCLLPS
jgi:hypothetical protein